MEDMKGIARSCPKEKNIELTESLMREFNALEMRSGGKETSVERGTPE